MVIFMCSNPALQASITVTQSHDAQTHDTLAHDTLAHDTQATLHELEVVRGVAAEPPEESHPHLSLAHLCFIFAMGLALFMPTIKALYRPRNRREVNEVRGNSLNLRAPPQKDLLCISRT